MLAVSICLACKKYYPGHGKRCPHCGFPPEAEKIHPSVTLERVTEAIEEASYGLGGHPGFCLACGADAEGCEPDAEGYTCEECEESSVYGAENVLLMICP